MNTSGPDHDQSRPGEIADLLDHIHQSPTPYHAAARTVGLLETAGFQRCYLEGDLPTEPGAYVTTVGGLVVAWVQSPGQDGFTIVGAHTDSPNLRIKPLPELATAGFDQLGVEVYGGVLLNSWLDRDLGIAGRVAVTDGRSYAQHLVRIDEPVLRVPQLAIHLDREISVKGLKLNPQVHLRPIWSLTDQAQRTADEAGSGPDEAAFTHYLAEQLGVAPGDIVGHDVMAYDTQPPALIGRNRDMFASARIDNLVSTFCGATAMAQLARDGADLRRCPVLVLYDHEEIGSESATGASGSVLAATLERIASARGVDRSGFLSQLSRSIAISADGAHATHPNYADKHDPQHNIGINQGVTIKSNANVRYATDARSEGFALSVAQATGLDIQHYSHRNDMPCGSTIGPMVAARLGVPTVDVGAPQLAMHSIREMAGVADVMDLGTFLAACWRSELTIG